MGGVGGVVVAAEVIETTVVGAGDTDDGNASPSALEGVEASVVNGVGACPMFSVDSGTKKNNKKQNRASWSSAKGTLEKAIRECGRDNNSCRKRGMACKKGTGGEPYGVIGCSLHYSLEQLTFRHDPNLCDACRYNQ